MHNDKTKLRSISLPCLQKRQRENEDVVASCLETIGGQNWYIVWHDSLLGSSLGA